MINFCYGFIAGGLTYLVQAAGRSATLPTKKHKDQVDKDQNRNAANNQDGCAENFSVFSSRELLSEKDREELVALREQVEDLKKQLSEKDELLKSAELSKNEMASIYVQFDELKNEAAEKDSLIKSTQLQLSDAKIKLADKQAAVEKLQWEAMTSNKKRLTRKDFAISAGDYDDVPYPLDENDDFDYEMDMQKLEAAREAYIAAVLAAKENQDDQSIAAAAGARFHLQSLVLKQN
ncbi:UNVERIFIED_CONTAM: protein MICROTUBULE BINDING PROTEIN 2C [Sesamum calycinum]|uniref:Protein MICROTUBULE BINDING PROTEIN 2C n=1 Tax=Sesamum calycinum TaxID=2727403 RepID=A0AAW2PN34_9LAMI